MHVRFFVVLLVVVCLIVFCTNKNFFIWLGLMTSNDELWRNFAFEHLHNRNWSSTGAQTNKLYNSRNKSIKRFSTVDWFDCMTWPWLRTKDKIIVVVVSVSLCYTRVLLENWTQILYETNGFDQSFRRGWVVTSFHSKRAKIKLTDCYRFLSFVRDKQGLDRMFQ